MTGKLILDGNQYKVLGDVRTVNVPYAAVTFHRAEVGDTITAITPDDEDKIWSAIENVVPESEF